MFSDAFVFLSSFYVDAAIDYDDDNDVLSVVNDIDDDNVGLPDLGILCTILKIMNVLPFQRMMTMMMQTRNSLYFFREPKLAIYRLPQNFCDFPPYLAWYFML
jgi:hypothetical protein